MTTPAVNSNKLDGSLGITPGSAGNLLAIMGPSSTGTEASPIALARVSDVISQFGYGPLTEFACYAIQNYGKPVLLIKAHATTVGATGSLVTTLWTGSSTPTIDAGSAPNDDYEYGIRIITGGTRGSAGIILQWTLDGGRTWSANVALGTGITYAIPNSGITIAFGAGLMIAGESVSGVSTAPACTASDLTAALLALRNSTQQWEFVCLANPMDSTNTLGAAMDAFIAGMWTIGKFRWWFSNMALPTSVQTDATYQTSLATYTATYSSTSGSVAAGAARVLSGVTSRGFNYIRPISMPVAPLILSVSEEVRVSEIDGMVLPGVSLTDANGNVAARCHDEMLYPGLDDARFLSLRTWADESGVWVNRPRMFGSASSDFDMIPKIRIWNLMGTILYSFFKTRLQKPVLADSKTGFILKSFHNELQDSANQVLAAALLKKPKASACAVSVSLTDPLLNTSTPNLTIDARVQPMGYFDFITLNMGFAVTVSTSL